MEDYKEKYEKALERAKSLHDSNKLVNAAILIEELFPELKESEDERIWTINYLNNRKLNSSIIEEKESLKKAIAWLEKQNRESVVTDALIKAGLKTYKDGNKWCVLVGDNIQDGICGFGDTVDEALFEFLKELAEKAGEQKSEELPNGEDYGIDSLYHAARILEKTLGEVDGYQSDDGILEHKCAIEAVNRLYKQKPAWSEEDEEMINGIIAVIEEDHLYDHSNIIDWLKSIKERYTWKPSDEQMEALEDSIEFLGCTKKVREYLKSLYQDLKRLREE